ncbi:hypothetical protein CFO_g351 [Ceratocystis platani]|uniref:DUF7732 domain-containing protein n=1 Tax=Ceratocystis fimbriata f. sp. platani TaxID=88771 RepID=A0A0F8B5A8_CERFI|nr:hypothetical protein CFO_g351 [Ceratocystis platani]
MKSSAITGPLAVFIALFVHVIAAPNIKIAPRTASLAVRDASVVLKDNVLQDLWKRRGGGGGGSRGSSSSGGRSGSSGSRGSSGSSSSSSSSRGSSSSSSSSRGGTGSPRTFGGGSYYAGGATTPYRSGSRSAAGLTGAFFAIGLLSFWPALWLTNAYLYHYPSSYRYQFHNQSSNANESLPVICACAENSLCGCDENNSTAYFNSLIGNGSYSGLNTSVVSVAQVNGTKTLLVNGTLSNDTTSPTEDSDGGDDSSMAILNSPVSLLGYWPVAVAAFAAIYVV